MVFLIRDEMINTDEKITESQLAQLDELLLSFSNVNNCSKTKVNGDDEDMIESVNNASNYANSENNFSFEINHIESSYG
jgi:hypothetical protein